MKKLTILFFILSASYATKSQCLTSMQPTNDCSGGAAISFVNLGNVATYPGGCITSDAYYYNLNSPYGIMIGASINYTILCGTTLAVAMWIDLNNNNIFSANEMLISRSPNTFHIGTFTVPTSATPFSGGKIRFRSAWNHQILGSEACVNDLGGAGDTQDYLISLFCGASSVPVISVSPANPVICKGGNVTLAASGANSYTWTPSNSHSSSFNVAPTVSTIYTVAGTNTSCPGTGKKIVTVTISDPIVSANASTNLMCVGESNTLSASGANSYSWSTQQSGAKVVITPTESGSITYTVTGTDVYGCKKSTTLTLQIEECVGLENYEKTNSISFYPNPVKQALTIKGGLNQTIEILNTSGQLVMTLTITGEKEIFVRDLGAGVYFIRSTHNPTVYKKFVIVD